MRRFITFFVGRPVTSVMTVVSLLLLGTISLERLPVGLLPNVASPGITIITRYPGVAAEKIEELITIPIERQVSDISGIDRILATSSEGESRVNLIFNHEADIMVKILDASESVQLIQDRFPREVEDPSIVRYDPSDRPVFIATFSSDVYDLKDLRELIDNRVKPRFERIDGVSEVFVGGGFEREIQVQTDASRLVAHSLSTQSVVEAVSAGNAFVPGGKLPGFRERFIYMDARFRSIEEMNATMLAATGERSPVRLDSLAHIVDGFRDRSSISSVNGEDRVTIYVQKAGNANTLGVTEACDRIMASLADLPDVRRDISYNQGESIRNAISQVQGSVIFGGIIATLVLYVFLRRTALTVLIGLSIPVSVMATFFLMFLSNLELNVMSLSGLALGAGMLIDNSIVVSEAIDRELAAGRDPDASVLEAAVNVRAELISSTLTTLVVFIPLIFANPETRLLYESLSLTIVYSLLVSLFLSLTVLPSLALALTRFERRHGADSGRLERALARGFEFARAQFKTSARSIEARVLVRAEQAGAAAQATTRRIVAWLRRAFQAALKVMSARALTALYKHYGWYLFRYPYVTILAPLALLAIAPIAYTFSKKDFSSPIESAEIEASVDLETGSHIDHTRAVTARVEKMIRAHPSVKEVTARIEKSRSTLVVKIDPEVDPSRSVEDVIGDLRGITDGFSDGFVYYEIASEAGGVQELNVEFFGDDIPALKRYASDISDAVQREVAGVDQVVLRFREGRRDIVVRPDRLKLATLGSSSAEAGNILRYLMSGVIITKYYDGDREVDVRFQGRPGDLDAPEDLAEFRLPLEGRSAPLASVVTLEEGEGEPRLWRKNKRKTVSITIKARGRSLEEVAADVEKVVRESEPPPDVIWAFGDEYERLLENRRQMLFAVVTAVLIVYLLLGWLFESFVQPLIIMTVVPVSSAASLVFLAAIGQPVTMSVYIGMIMLAGISVNNSILVVSAINGEVDLNRHRGRFLKELLHASAGRIRPILMTALTTIFGMAPMIFDRSESGGLWRPLAITVCFGLTVSIFASLTLAPFCSFHYYRWLARIKSRAAAQQLQLSTEGART